MAQEGSSGGSQGSAANVTHALKGIDFPCSKQDIIKHAQQNNADKTVLDELNNLPDEQYASMADVMKGFGQSR
ncbi:DUF2795 domain-containing protein [Magnetospirillum sp. UT-4]|uniref:DUF2795 domain-containing protein n=1 Tax=Magnetospirillum sp. UT-4 TaxID=2681467 RepID=UPI00137F5123|nr:DUF2795 domain-containing protein [Magnetospirillum sp. UT-4]CAA7613874.1 conserved hypothetical protein [Magnetospirillum sp. UT-4]